MPRSAWLVAVASACIGLLSWSSLRGDARPVAPIEHDDGRDELMARLERLDDEVKRLRRELDRARSSAGDSPQALHAAAAQAAALSPERSTPSAGPEAPNAAYEADWQKIVDRFERENDDARWDPSSELSRKIGSIMQAGAMLRSLDCRRSLCRLETAHPDEASYVAFTEHFTILKGDAQLWTGAADFRVTHEPNYEGDSLLAVAFLHREPAD